MSTRYVWDVYSVATERRERHELVYSDKITVNTSLNYSGAMSSEYEFDGAYELISPIWQRSFFRVDADVNKCLIIQSSDVETATARSATMYYNKYQDEYSEPLQWFGLNGTGSSPYFQYTLMAVKKSAYGSASPTPCKFAKYTVESVPIQGTEKTGIVSSADRNAYPDNGVSGNAWYVYKDSDTIDPLSVTYNTDKPERGEVVTVSVEPQSGKEVGLSWKQTVMPSNSYWNSVAYGNGRFVAGASNEIAAYSADGISWTSATLPFNFSLQDVTYGDGKFIAIGSNSNKAAFSADGVNWSDATLPSTAYWNSITFGNGRFVAVARNSDKAAYSDDGVNWTEKTLPETAYWHSVTYGNGKFVAVSDNSDKAAYSTDGINWTSATLPLSAYWSGITYGNGKFVAAAHGSDKAAYSADGVNWTAIELPSSIRLTDVTYGDGRFVAVAGANSSKSAYSVDGINWTETALPDTATWISVAYGDEKFVAVANGSNKATYAPTTSDTAGVISYLYQYSTDGGKSWVSAGNATTDTQKEITVPSNAEFFMARVRAQDDIGFTSSDYVAGANLEVQVMKLWVGVDNKARRGKKLWIGVDGKARRVVRAWVGDESGKARRWF